MDYNIFKRENSEKEYNMDWKKELKNNITTLEELKQYIPISLKEEKAIKKVIEIHPMSITRYYLSLIDKNDPNDPIKKMIIPSSKELNLSGSYDTSGEAQNTKLVGLQHKYSQTALILATNRCAAYCRYCFRKRLVGIANEEVVKRFQKAVNYIKEHKEINNVLITGGDPFILPNSIIEKFLKLLYEIEHIDFIRFGTRIPVTFPQRIYSDNEFLNILKKYSKKNKRIYVVTQFNHPNEITKQSTDAINKLINANIIINNQTVLLKGINDNPAILAELMKNLVRIGVNPYYVFQCRPVKRVKSAYQITLKQGVEITETAKALLNGHAKRFKYVMSHKTGKIEILGIMGNEIFLKYHQAKHNKNMGKFFKLQLKENACWLDDLK